jgi:hypothetical protein
VKLFDDVEAGDGIDYTCKDRNDEIALDSVFQRTQIIAPKK